MASCLAAALEPAVDLSKLPKSVVDVYILILEAGGAEAAVAATAASLALADAGIEMLDLVAACSVVRRVRVGLGPRAPGCRRRCCWTAAGGDRVLVRALEGACMLAALVSGQPTRNS
jgi:hypothetical protein